MSKSGAILIARLEDAIMNYSASIGTTFRRNDIQVRIMHDPDDTLQQGKELNQETTIVQVQIKGVVLTRSEVALWEIVSETCRVFRADSQESDKDLARKWTQLIAIEKELNKSAPRSRIAHAARAAAQAEVDEAKRYGTNVLGKKLTAAKKVAAACEA